MTNPSRGRADYLKLGDYNAECSMCGRKRKASYLVQNWQGMWRCPEHNEPRNTQDFVRNPPAEKPPPWIQPHRQVFVYVCSPNGRTAIVGAATVGCAVVGYIDPAYDPSITEQGLP
jgi:hypothetical protein